MKMKRNLSHISVPFPPMLMSSRSNATNMPFEFGREIRNMTTSLSGAGNKRNGFSKYGLAIENETIITLMPYVAASGSQLLALTQSGKLFKTDNKVVIEKYDTKTDVSE